MTVLEAEERLAEDMRASTFHPPTLDMLIPSGIADVLIALGHRARQWQYLRTDTGDAAIFDLSVLSDLTRHPYRLQCEQFHLTRAIVEKLSGHPLFDIVFGATVTGLTDEPAGVRIQAEVNGSPSTFTGAYVVGADGAGSTVRRLLGLELKGETYPRTSITVAVSFPFEKHLGHMLDVNYVWTAADHYSLMRLGGHWRTGFSPAPGESVEDAMSDRSIQGHLNRILPSDRPYDIARRGAYTVHRRITDTFRVGRVLLAGDAAHLNSPSGGMGMNSGIHDAHTLAESLAPVLGGQDQRLLDIYSRRRRTVAVEDIQAQSDLSYWRHRERDAARREEIWADLKATCADRPRMRGFLLRSSMIASIRRAAGIH